jgi:hypothetical protein
MLTTTWSLSLLFPDKARRYSQAGITSSRRQLRLTITRQVPQVKTGRRNLRSSHGWRMIRHSERVELSHEEVLLIYLSGERVCSKIRPKMNTKGS